MIVVDTSIWIDHIRVPNAALNALLLGGDVVHHPFVTQEIALGSIASRADVLKGLAALPAIVPAGTDELLEYIEKAKLMGTGVGLVDASLLAGSDTSGARLWTRDKRLHAQAERLGLAYTA